MSSAPALYPPPDPHGALGIAAVNIRGQTIHSFSGILKVLSLPPHHHYRRSMGPTPFFPFCPPALPLPLLTASWASCVANGRHPRIVPSISQPLARPLSGHPCPCGNRPAPYPGWLQPPFSSSSASRTFSLLPLPLAPLMGCSALPLPKGRRCISPCPSSHPNPAAALSPPVSLASCLATLASFPLLPWDSDSLNFDGRSPARRVRVTRRSWRGKFGSRSRPRTGGR